MEKYVFVRVNVSKITQNFPFFAVFLCGHLYTGY
jgi:hypothetical protein